MMLNLYQVDAFTTKVFGGNPAAVVPLENWLEDKVLQNIAMENNLSETAFFVKNENSYDIRWFTPNSEVDLCGHATLASAFIIFNYFDFETPEIVFNSKSGSLKVTKHEELLSLNFPSRNPKEIDVPKILINALEDIPSKVLFDKTILCIFDSEEKVKNLKPQIKEFLKLKTHGVIISAPGENVDFVSRFFAPDVGIDEDPVTGYAHTLLIPYWSKELEKDMLTAKQISKRGGELFCENHGERVVISGKAVLYCKGTIYL